MLQNILAWLADAAYQYSGYSQPEVQYKGNAVKTTAAGKRRITFKDGTIIEITYPKYYLRGNLPSSARCISIWPSLPSLLNMHHMPMPYILRAGLPSMRSVLAVAFHLCLRYMSVGVSQP